MLGTPFSVISVVGYRQPQPPPAVAALPQQVGLSPLSQQVVCSSAPQQLVCSVVGSERTEVSEPGKSERIRAHVDLLVESVPCSDTTNRRCGPSKDPRRTQLVGVGGPVEVARHQISTPGSPRIDDAQFSPAPAGALDRVPRPKTAGEAAFLQLGDGAVLWLTEAAATGATRVRGQDGRSGRAGPAAR